jgi:hypothetical protein
MYHSPLLDSHYIPYTLGRTGLLHPSPAPHFKIVQVLLIYFPKRPGVKTVQMYTPIAALCLCNGNQLDVRNIYP